jgi:hypothetical protein
VVAVIVAALVTGGKRTPPTAPASTAGPAPTAAPQTAAASPVTAPVAVPEVPSAAPLPDDKPKAHAVHARKYSGGAADGDKGKKKRNWGDLVDF